jgi:hypothetical protein
MNNTKCEAAIIEVVKYYTEKESDKTTMHKNEIYALSYLIDEMSAHIKIECLNQLTISELQHVIAKVIFAFTENQKKVVDKSIDKKVEVR